MTFILDAQQASGDIDESRRQWAQYQAYLRERQAIFPAGAYELATSDWYYDFQDHRAPHDAWLEWARFEEVSSGERSEIRHLSLRVRLLGAYHDCYLEYFYPVVYAYSLSSVKAERGNLDWLCDEFRLSDEGHVLHEIEWGGSNGVETRWLVEASDVQFATFPIDR